MDAGRRQPRASNSRTASVRAEPLPRLLVTGSRGFVGGTVGRVASDAGWRVAGVARTQAPKGWPGLHVHADVTRDDLTDFVRHYQPDLVIHAVGTASVSGSYNSPLADFRSNVIAWSRVLDAMRRAESRAVVVFVSSAAVYGQPQMLPVREDSPTSPLSPYGYHKLVCEMIGDEYVACFGLRVIAARAFSLVGERQRRLLVWEVAQQALAGADPVRIRGTGLESRDFLYIEDFAHAVLALTSVATPDDHALRLNVARGEETRVSELVDAIQMCVGRRSTVQYQGQASLGDPSRWVADVSIIRRALPGWSPRSLELMLRRCLLDWGRS